MYEITSGKINKAKKVVIYGVEGIGKTLLAGKFPNPVFIDTEGSTGDYDIKRMPAPTSWTMLLDEIKQFGNSGKTLVIDTVDWAEKLAIAHICDVHQWKGIEDAGYGSGYRYVYEEMGRMADLLTELVNRGINVVMTAHAAVRKIELPNEMGSFDRWELKLQNSQKCNVAAMVKEWADLLLFANYQTFIVQDGKSKKNKAQGKKRMMYTTYNATYDAKNRYGLPEEMELDYAGIAHLFNNNTSAQPTPAVTEQPIQPVQSTQDTQTAQQEQPVIQTPQTPEEPQSPPSETTASEKPPEEPPQVAGTPNFRLIQLMHANNVTDRDIRHAVAQAGYFPEDMLIKDYPPEFVSGCLLGAWEQVLMCIKQNKENAY